MIASALKFERFVPVESPRTPAEIDALVNENIRLAKFMAAQQRRTMDEHEAFSIALDGLWHAAQKWAPERCGKFGTFAAKRIRWHFGHRRNFLSRPKRGDQFAKVHLDSEIPTTDGTTATFSDVIADDHALNAREIMLHAEQIARVVAVARTLGPRDSVIIIHRFGLAGRRQMTLEELGARFHLTRERIRQIEARILGELRALMSKDDIAKKGNAHGEKESGQKGRAVQRAAAR
jgi:RNA polymerase sigma factor (sigma-70 family)